MENRVGILVWVAALALFGTSCDHKKLCYDHRHTTVRVEFDWAAAPDAAPAGMCVLFYPAGGGAPEVKEFAGKEGGSIDIPDGVYDVVCYNADASNVSYRDVESLDALEACVRESSVMEGLDGGLAAPPLVDDGESVVAAPGRLWSCRVDGVELVPDGQGADNVVVLAPRCVTRHVFWEVSPVTGSGNLRVVRAVLSGMSGSLRLGACEPASALVSIPSAGEADGGDPEKLTGGFECFGCPGGTACRHMLTLYCWSAYGNVMASWDVTDQVHAASADGDIHIVVTVTGGITIPEEGSGDFDPDVDGWDDRYSDVIM